MTSIGDFTVTLGVRPIDGINLLILCAVTWILVRVIADDKNTIIWSDFISTQGTDGRQHGDLNKVGQLVGIVVAAMAVLMYADNEKVEPGGLAGLLAVALAYLGMVSSYASYLRSKRGSIETTRTVEPAVPTKTTEVKVETPPITSPQGPGA